MGKQDFLAAGFHWLGELTRLPPAGKTCPPFPKNSGQIEIRIPPGGHLAHNGLEPFGLGNGGLYSWCERGDSNPHPLRDQILSSAQTEDQQLTSIATNCR
jgi:hypothetical protein